jgi:hypothetical protein
MKKKLRAGLVWGSILYVITMIIFPLVDGERLSWFKLIFGIPLWMLIGSGIGYFFKKRKKTAKG